MLSQHSTALDGECELNRSAGSSDLQNALFNYTSSLYHGLCSHSPRRDTHRPYALNSIARPHRRPNEFLYFSCFLSRYMFTP